LTVEARSVSCPMSRRDPAAAPRARFR